MSWNYVYDYVDSHRDQITTDFYPSGLFVSEKPPDAGPDGVASSYFGYTLRAIPVESVRKMES